MKDTKINKFLYGNKFFEYLKGRELSSYNADFERMGVSIIDQAKFDVTVERAAIGTYWIFATIVLVVAYAVISPFI